jgi:hypothetical protein
MTSFLARLSALAVLTVGSSLLAADTPVAPPKGARVFSAGHSFHVPMVMALDEIATKNGVTKHDIAGAQFLGGSSVTQHWDLPDEKDKARKAIKAGKVDVLTLSPHFLAPDPAIDKFTSLLMEHNPKGRVTIQISWLPNSDQIGKILKYDDRERDKTEPDSLRKAAVPWEERFRTQAKKLNEEFAAKAGREVVYIVPTGEAVYRLRERVVKGTVPGIAKQSDLYLDSLGHGKPPISVLNAYCHYAVIYGQSPIGLPVPNALKAAKLGDNTEKVNRILQECAWEAVCGEPMSGVKPVKTQ